MSSPISPSPPKPTLPPFWKWLMRVTFAVTMVLFLAPAVYVVKYYAVDRAREEAIAKRTDMPDLDGPQTNPDYLLRELRQAEDPHGDTSSRRWAITEIGDTLQRPGISYQRPLECLSAKATLADLAAKDRDPAVRAAASQELGKVAQGGAVIRR